MYKKAKYITTLSRKDGRTTYLLCRDPQTLVALEIKDMPGLIYPDLKTLCHHILNALKARVIAVKIYKYQDGIFYTYLTLEQDNRRIDINTPPNVALKACRLFEASLLISETIVKTIGLRITKNMIEKALENKCAGEISY